MNSSLTVVQSSWIEFLRHYGPVPRNDSMYDEFVQKSLKRKNIKPIEFESEHISALIENFASETPLNVILTGTAGDGKTFYCREIWKALGGSDAQWNQGEKIQWLKLSAKTLVIIKDLSELENEQKKKTLQDFCTAVTADGDQVFLIAANDGQLMEACNQLDVDDNSASLKKALEDLLLTDSTIPEVLNFRLYNLSRLSAGDVYPRILSAIIEHPGWEQCTACPLSQDESITKCPIWENRSRLRGNIKENVLTSRLVDILRLCDLNGVHLPVRQLLLLTVNALLGHPEAKDRLLACKEVPDIIKRQSHSAGSVFRNIFGENLGERKRENTEVFAALNQFGIGSETSNPLDNVLIFGEDDPELRDISDRLLRNDSYFGADQAFLMHQEAYLESTASDEAKTFLSLLRAQRQRLFFTMSSEDAELFHLWHLTVYQNAGEYLKEIVGALAEDRRPARAIVTKLVRGLNRIFLGVLLNNQDELFMATSGSHSQARYSPIYAGKIPVTRERGEYIAIEKHADSIIPSLVVSLGPNLDKIALPLNLMRYEYLTRVADGSLPTSFSQECYEDILAFKARILRQLKMQKDADKSDESESNEHIDLRLIELGSDGIARPRSLEIDYA